MTLTYEHAPGRIQMKEDGTAFFDTDYYPVMLGPSTVEITGQTVTFPDLLKGIGYGFARGLIGSTMNRSCHSLITLGAQEWGPENMRPEADDPSRVLSETVLTTVPAACDGLIVQVNLARTSAPSQVNGITIPVLPKEGEWVTAPGGSLPLEYLFPVSRQMDIVLQTDADGDPVFNVDGTRNVVLQRRQSVNRKFYTFYRSDTLNSGWTAHGTGVGQYGHLVHSIEAKGPSGTPGDGTDYAYGGSNQCSLTDPTDYSSEYSADIRITPMFMNEAPENSGSNSKSAFFVGHQTIQNPSGQTVWDFDPIYAGAEHPTRYAYVLISTSVSTVMTTSIGGVTINGVPATALVPSFDNDDVIDWALFYANVPTGEELNIQATMAGSGPQGIYCSAHIAYNLSSPTVPFNLVNSNLASTPSSPDISITTTPGAFCLFMAANRIFGPFPTFGGFINPGFRGPEQIEDPVFQSPGAPLTGWAATHLATGTSLGVKAQVDEDSAGSSNFALGQYRWFAVVLQ